MANRLRIHFNGRGQKGYVNLTLDGDYLREEWSKVAHKEIDKRWPWMRGIVQKIEENELRHDKR